MARAPRSPAPARSPIIFSPATTGSSGSTAAVEKQKSLRIAVVGTGSSALAGPDGPQLGLSGAARGRAAARFPGVDIKVVTLVRTRLTARDLARNMGKVRR